MAKPANHGKTTGPQTRSRSSNSSPSRTRPRHQVEELFQARRDSIRAKAGEERRLTEAHQPVAIQPAQALIHRDRNDQGRAMLKLEQIQKNATISGLEPGRWCASSPPSWSVTTP